MTEASQFSFHAIRSRSRLLVKSLKFIFAPFTANRSRIANDELSSTSNQRRSVWHSHNMQQLPLSIRFISGLFYWLQPVSAMTCVVLSTMRLASQDFGKTEEADKANRDFALNVFYVMALAEALVFLAEKAFWEWKVSYCGLLEKVNAEYQLGQSGMISIKRFFYDAYSKCVTGSIFDGLKMDLVTFAEELLVSSSGGEKLMGARILLALSTHQRLSDAAIRKIRTSTVVIERLIEMLNWKSHSEEEVRYKAAVIVSKLADEEQNALCVVGIPGAMESISSLLDSGPTTKDGRKYDFLAFNLLGLLILKKLAKVHDICAKMRNICGLLDKIIEFTSICRGIDLKAVKRSLEVVKMLVSTRGHTGIVFQQEISGMVLTSSNMRDILRHGGHQLGLKRLALEVVTKLAMDGEARERIGRTGGMVKELLGVLFDGGCECDELRAEAGEALAMLALESKANCGRIIEEQKRSVEKLTEALDDRAVSVSCSRILQRMCAYTGTERCRELSAVVAGFRKVFIQGIMEMDKHSHEELPLLEASLGLAAEMLKLMSAKRLSEELRRAGLSEAHLVTKLVRLLEASNVNEIRRFGSDLAVQLMAIDKNYVNMFEQAGIDSQLVR